ncbi:MAG TPA: hypothetical protein VF173_14315 [Thermoanaerobaculia bacterium]|nr:hypothetical protein [Thermoanaerobaculia bacterium]
MSRRVQLVLLCEDKQQEVFARRFLNAVGWETRAMRVEKAPPGRGAGEQFVRERFPRELKAHRSRPVSQALVVMMDGDAAGPAARLQQLGKVCREAGIAERAGDERVAVFIPTWNIETWLAYLEGRQVEEGRSDYPRLASERDCQRHVEALVQMCRTEKLREPAPSSLNAACSEYHARLASRGTAGSFRKV